MLHYHSLVKNWCWVEKNLWIALSPQGIQLFRDQGRQKVIDQLVKTLIENQQPRNWYFCTESDFSDITIPCTSPIWLNEQKIENLQIFRAKVPVDLCYFKGHFADFPLVPGVIELQWVMDKITSYFGQEIPVIRIDNLKFQKFLRPNDEFELILKWDEAKYRMIFQLKTNNEICGSGLFVLQNG